MPELQFNAPVKVRPGITGSALAAEIISREFDTRSRQLFQGRAGILQAYGITDLSQVAPLDFSTTATPALVATPGVTVGGDNVLGGQITYTAATRYDAQTNTWIPNGGTGTLVRALPAPSSGTPGLTIPKTPLQFDYDLLHLGWNSTTQEWEAGRVQPGSTGDSRPVHLWALPRGHFGPPPPPPGGGGGVIQLPPGTSFWAADTITIPANALIVVPPSVTLFIIMAKHLNIGAGVALTWTRAQIGLPSTGATGSTGTPGPNGTGKATDGGQGGRGNPGGNGDDQKTIGSSAPSVELWALDAAHTLWMDLAGQDGGQGGKGGTGGQGGRGGDGSPEVWSGETWIGSVGICEAGAGSGGQGGQGGPGGTGGTGSSGGSGGDATLYLGSSANTTFFQDAVIEGSPGDGGPGGAPGDRGPGGPGGSAGIRPHNCSPAAGRLIQNGQTGGQGSQGSAGQAGSRGAHQGTFTTVAITESDWDYEFSLPHVATVSPQQARPGTTIVLTGNAFDPADVVVVESVDCQTTVVADNQINFVLPDVPGWDSSAGRPNGYVRRSDGRESTPFSIVVIPQLASLLPASAAAGDTVTVTGKAIPGAPAVFVDDHPQPGVVVTGTDTVSFRLELPATVAPGGRSTVTVALPGGTRSNGLSLQLVAHGMAVFGDSIAWGQGLLPNEKFSTEVAAAFGASLHTQVTPQVSAHSGAIIGVGNTTNLAALDGEVPTSFPTILSQVAGFTGQPDDIGLVLVDGGINDCDVRTILSPSSTQSQLTALANQHCGQDMGTLLDAVCAKFPLATVCVTGYYQILSKESVDTTEVELLIGLLSIFDFPAAVLAQLGLTDFEGIATRSGQWANDANTALQQAVAGASGRHPNRIVFADPMFAPQNAIFASDSFIFGLNADLSPQDPVSAQRQQSCQLAGARTDALECAKASIGHPNPKGAEAYTTAVRKALGL